MRINLACYRLPHMHAESGYPQVHRYLAEKTVVEYLEPWLPRPLPKAVMRRLAARPRAAFYEPASVQSSWPLPVGCWLGTT